jgi:hypothetical protein
MELVKAKFIENFISELLLDDFRLLAKFLDYFFVFSIFLSHECLHFEILNLTMGLEIVGQKEFVGF